MIHSYCEIICNYIFFNDCSDIEVFPRHIKMWGNQVKTPCMWYGHISHGLKNWTNEIASWDLSLLIWRESFHFPDVNKLKGTMDEESYKLQSSV